VTKWTRFLANLFLAAALAHLIASGLWAQTGVTTPESASRGKEVLLAAANAAGSEKLASVKTLGINESGKLIGPQGDTVLNVKWMVSYPDRSHGEVTIGDQKIVQVCDGTSAWLQFAQGIRDTTPVISEFKRGISLFGGWGIYQQVLAGKLSGQFIGETEIDGKKMIGVALEGPFGPLKLYFYPDTHLLAAASFNPRENMARRTTSSAGAITGRSMASRLRSPPSSTAKARSFSNRLFKMCN
jgi:hypothetical protein